MRYNARVNTPTVHKTVEIRVYSLFETSDVGRKGAKMTYRGTGETSGFKGIKKRRCLIILILAPKTGVLIILTLAPKTMFNHVML